MYETLNSEHYQQIMKFVLTLNNADVFEKEVLQQLRNLVEFDKGIFLTLKNDSSVDHIYGYQTDNEFLREYTLKCRGIDPLVDFRHRATSRSLADQTLAIGFHHSNKDRDRQLYKNFYIRYDIGHCLMFPINERGDGIRLYRSGSAAGFTEQEIEICKYVGTAIGDLYKHHLRDEEIKSKAKLYNMIRNNMYFGVLLFNCNFKLISYNKVGIERMNEITHEKGIEEMSHALTVIIKEMMENEAKSGQNLTIYKIMENYIIELLINRELDEFGNIITHYVVFVYGRAWFSSILTLSAEQVIDHYELTEREKQLVNLILQGDSNQQISEKLFISTYTVKEHIKSIFRKMNLKSRGELIIKVYADRGWISESLSSDEPQNNHQVG